MNYRVKTKRILIDDGRDDEALRFYINNLGRQLMIMNAIPLIINAGKKGK